MSTCDTCGKGIGYPGRAVYDGSCWECHSASELWGFEALTDGQWSSEAAGSQDASNYLATREEAEAQLPRLAATLGCPVSEVRVVRVSA